MFKKFLSILILFIIFIDFPSQIIFGIKETNDIKEQLILKEKIEQQKNLDEVYKEFIAEINPFQKDEIIQNIIYNTKKNAMEMNIDPLLVLAIMGTESSFKIYAKTYKKNEKGKKRILAYGLMQINLDVWLDRSNPKNLIDNHIINSKEDLENIYYNIRAGIYIFKIKIQTCKKYRSKNLLKRRGYDNLQDCSVSRYNGTILSEYYDKIKQNVGQLYLKQLIS